MSARRTCGALTWNPVAGDHPSTKSIRIFVETFGRISPNSGPSVLKSTTASARSSAPPVSVGLSRSLSAADEISENVSIPSLFESPPIASDPLKKSVVISCVCGSTTALG